MNLPNKLTVIRIVCTPVFYALFVTCLQLSDTKQQFYIMSGLFIFWLFLEITDVLDGYIARKRGLVSDLGKLMDPFSDVLSRLTFFFCFALAGIYPFWPLLIIFWRELFITFIRAVLAQTGVTLPAGNSGKIKAVFYFAASMYGMGLCLAVSAKFIRQDLLPAAVSAGSVLFMITALISVLSFIPYFINFIKTDYMQKHIRE